MVSVIMPAYNAGKTIKQSLESIARQSFKDWELVVIDDCSVDETAEVVEKFIEKNRGFRIKVIKNNENRGAAYCRNEGVRHSKGNWIAFLDSDDLWEPYKLEKQMKYVCDRNISEGLVFSGSAFITKDNSRIDYLLHVPTEISKGELLKQNLISCSSVLVSRNLILKHAFPENIKNIHEDFAVWINILGDIPCAYGIDEPLLIYRISEASKSGKKTKAAVMNWNTYRYVGMGMIKSIYYMTCYSIRGILKWGRIKAAYRG